MQHTLAFRARFEPDGEGFLVTFPDIPQAITGGDDMDEALHNAREALELALLTYVIDDRPFPPPAVVHGDEFRTISVSAAVAAKLVFIEAFRTSGLTQHALAERLGKGRTEVRRMLDPYHATKLPRLEAGLEALGKRLVISVEEAA